MIQRGEWVWKINIRQITGDSQDAYGEPTGGSESTFASRWAKKEYHGAGTENLEADRESQIQSITWTTDYISGLGIDMWVEDSSGNEFDIINAQEMYDGRNHIHVLKTKQRQ